MGYPGNPASIRQELANANVSLGALMEDLQLFGKGKGSPFIDRLASQMVATSIPAKKKEKLDIDSLMNDIF